MKTIKELQVEALKYKTRSEFKANSNSSYKSACKQGILDKICDHMPKDYNKPYTIKELITEALKFKTRGDFFNNNQSAYQAARRKGVVFFDKICSHMSESLTKSWTFEELWEEALKFKTRVEFARKSKSSYNIACRMKILDTICSHMPKHVDQSGENSAVYKWTFKMIHVEALKFETRGEFRNNSAAYNIAAKRNILDRVCGHMKKPSNVSIPERDLMGVIKKVYPSAKKFIDRKVSILNKPHIKGFEIDIFVPKKNKGIEFDGNRYHSFEFMRKSKKLWSDEDIRNYHEIKDTWFLTKGIDILHIKEDDWNKDREKCIKRCLNFLKTKKD